VKGSVTNCELALLDVIRRKALRPAATNGNPEKLPMKDLMRMDLDHLITTVEPLARANGQSDKRQIVFLASRIVSDWPTRFIEFLGRERDPEEHQPFQRRVNKTYIALCGATQRRLQMEFLGSLTVEFALKSLGL
jgi:hypothetical protein